MITAVKLDNFRCFGKSSFEGFTQVNLIGGKNNVGKTAFQIIDPSIEEVKTLSIGSPSVYIRKKDCSFLPIALFGDAISKVGFLV